MCWKRISILLHSVFKKSQLCWNWICLLKGFVALPLHACNHFWEISCYLPARTRNNLCSSWVVACVFNISPNAFLEYNMILFIVYTTTKYFICFNCLPLHFPPTVSPSDNSRTFGLSPVWPLETPSHKQANGDLRLGPHWRPQSPKSPKSPKVLRLSPQESG